jgi:hypothetical protein
VLKHRNAEQPTKHWRCSFAPTAPLLLLRSKPSDSLHNIKYVTNSFEGSKVVGRSFLSEPKKGPPEIAASSHARAASASLQAYSPSTRVKAAAAQVVDLNWNSEKRILLPTIKVAFTETDLPFAPNSVSSVRGHTQQILLANLSTC